MSCGWISRSQVLLGHEPTNKVGLPCAFGPNGLCTKLLSYPQVSQGKLRVMCLSLLSLHRFSDLMSVLKEPCSFLALMRYFSLLSLVSLMQLKLQVRACLDDAAGLELRQLGSRLTSLLPWPRT